MSSIIKLAKNNIEKLKYIYNYRYFKNIKNINNQYSLYNEKKKLSIGVIMIIII